MFFWEALGPGNLMDPTSEQTSHLNIDTDQEHPQGPAQWQQPSSRTVKTAQEKLVEHGKAYDTLSQMSVDTARASVCCGGPYFVSHCSDPSWQLFSRFSMNQGHNESEVSPIEHLDI